VVPGAEPQPPANQLQSLLFSSSKIPRYQHEYQHFCALSFFLGQAIWSNHRKHFRMKDEALKLRQLVVAARETLSL
jgi:hypothetical protein